MSGIREVSGGGASFSGSLWQKVKLHFQRLRPKSTIKGTHLLDLNDDCLREIMSFLTKEDLCSVAESSTESSIRLKDIATEVFIRSRKITDSNEKSMRRIHEPRRVFENFGSVILANVLTFTNLTKLSIHCHVQNLTEFMHDLNSLTSLTSLSLHSVSGDAEFMVALAKLKQLRSLTLILSFEVSDLNPLAELDNLEFLQIVERYRSDKLSFDIVQIVKRLLNVNGRPLSGLNYSDTLHFDIIQLKKRLRNLKFLCVSVRKFRLDKETYMRLVDLVREQGRIRLHLVCAVHENVADVQSAGFNDYLVHILGLSSSFR